jgi:oxygen-independent coproporphyrinogen-3 oxidase
MSQWRQTLEKALSISSRGVLPQHISSYQLSVEPGSMLSRLVEKGSWTEASEEVFQEQYSELCSVLASAGYNHYEISNFAQPGFEARHNSAYWSHVPYVGLGPGAHSFSCEPSPLDGGRLEQAGESFSRRWNQSDLQAYLDAFRKGDFLAVREGESLTADQLTLEHIMLGLRTSAGLPAAYLRTHCTPAALSRALSLGHLVPVTESGQPLPPCDCLCAIPAGSFLRIPEQHFFVSDAIISDLV